MELGLTLDELLTIYRIQFTILKKHEADTWYDATGRIVFTVNKGLPGVGLPRKADPKDTADTLETPTSTRTGLSSAGSTSATSPTPPSPTPFFPCSTPRDGTTTRTDIAHGIARSPDSTLPVRPPHLAG